MMFDQGRVIEDAVPDKLFTAPEHQRTRDFLRAVIERA
jgi:polar amino acid transport system ATP-binding protein